MIGYLEPPKGRVTHGDGDRGLAPGRVTENGSVCPRIPPGASLPLKAASVRPLGTASRPRGVRDPAYRQSLPRFRVVIPI